MNNALTTARWTESLAKYLPVRGGNCGLGNCRESRSLWQRLRRGHSVSFDGVPYWHFQCLEMAVRRELPRLCRQSLPAPPPNRIPLGLLMIARGKLTYAEVAAGLEAQRRARYGNIGEWFQKLGFATEQDVTAALGLQWGCPVATSLATEFNGATQHLPFAILEDSVMWPLHRVPSMNILYIACGKRVDHRALAGIEKMLSCRTQPCVASSREIFSRIEGMRQQARGGEVEFRSMRDENEMVRIAISYIARTGAVEIRSSRVGGWIWLLLRSHSTILNLLFQPPSQAQPLLPA